MSNSRILELIGVTYLPYYDLNNGGTDLADTIVDVAKVQCVSPQDLRLIPIYEDLKPSYKVIYKDTQVGFIF